MRFYETMGRGKSAGLELWGGVECSVNRLDGSYLDQQTRVDHDQRAQDLARFAAIGFKALRFPVLWERMAPEDGFTVSEWTSADEGLRSMRELGMRPIVGLVHHGSGPRVTNLLDPKFGERLASYARQIAERYSWVEDYTPVNEPLTTARFSALYGHWYPHARDPLSFARALFNQIKAVVLAMRAIREVNPRARLIQTEDLAKIYSTQRLAYQADFENERRWLTFDLLLGRVDSQHPLWSYFTWAGVHSSELDWFVQNPCPPDVFGLNYYVVGERLLDERLSRYPERAHASNGRDVYADVSAARTLLPGITGVEGLLQEVWDRYGRPIAVTEAHLSCTREEQMRWLVEIWNAAWALQSRGVEINAVTVWSLLGSHDWNSLLTRDDGHYESGVFDLRAPEPRRTALADLAESLAHGRQHEHPVLATPGWWRREQRLSYCGTTAVQHVRLPSASVTGVERPILIAGRNGILGDAFRRLCELRGLAHRLLDRAEMDIADPISVRRAINRYAPWAVVNAAGRARVDQAEEHTDSYWRDHVTGAETLAVACAEHGNIPLVTFSSHLVFDGRATSPYREDATPNPLNHYGRCKAEAERRVLAALPAALVVRTSAFFGPWDETNFVTKTLRSLTAGEEVQLARDEVVSPTYVPDLVHAALDLLIDGERGVWHLANGGAVTWGDFAVAAAEAASANVPNLRFQSAGALDGSAVRPAFSALTSNRGWIMRPWQEALQLYFRDRNVATQSQGDTSPDALAPAA
jgi:dTDP-4-dehydrorhamnose reductase